MLRIVDVHRLDLEIRGVVFVVAIHVLPAGEVGLARCLYY